METSDYEYNEVPNKGELWHLQRKNNLTIPE